MARICQEDVFGKGDRLDNTGEVVRILRTSDERALDAKVCKVGVMLIPESSGFLQIQSMSQGSSSGGEDAKFQIPLSMPMEEAVTSCSRSTREENGWLVPDARKRTRGKPLRETPYVGNADASADM